MELNKVIKGCQQYDTRCQRELVIRYTAYLKTICRLYVGEEDAKDVLQEAFMIIFTKVNNYELTGCFKAWMRKITIRCALAWLKKKELIRSKEEKACNVMQVQPLIYDHLHEEELISLIQSLPQLQKIVFSLNVIEGYAHKEIAEMLGINETTSRSHLLRARKKLQKSIYPNAVKIRRII